MKGPLPAHTEEVTMTGRLPFFAPLVAMVFVACGEAATAPAPVVNADEVVVRGNLAENAVVSVAAGNVFVEDQGVAAGLGIEGSAFRAQLNFVALESNPHRGQFHWTLRRFDGGRWQLVGTVEGRVTDVHIAGNEAHLHGLVERGRGSLESLVGETFNAHVIDSAPSGIDADRVHWHWGTGPCPCGAMDGAMSGSMGGHDPSMMWRVSDGNLVVQARAAGSI
jgi:hypothetical protein